MSKTAVISFRVDEETLAKIDRLAGAYERSRAWVTARLVKKASEREIEFLDFVDAGIADLDAGRTVTHENLVAEIKVSREGRKAA